VLLGGGRPLAAMNLGRLTIGPAVRFWAGGECLYAPATSHRRAAAILLAGPLAADACFVVAGATAAAWRHGALHHPAVQLSLWIFALVCLGRATVEIAGWAGWIGAREQPSGTR
jgi:hypothetical protein